MNRLKRFQNVCVRFFTFSQSTSTKMNLLHTTIRKQMTWREKMKNNNQNESVTQSIHSSFSQTFVCRQHVIFSIFAVNQNASINKNSKSSNSRNLKQHTFAKSISLCCFCFCFCFCLFWKIDRFIILICKYLSHQSTKFSIKILIFVIFAYILFSLSLFCFRIYFFTSIASTLKLSTSIMIRQIFESQSMNFSAMSIDRKNEYSFRDEIWKKRKDNVTSVSEISIENLFYQREFIWELVWFDAHFYFWFSCKYLFSRSNILVMLFVF